MRLKFLCLTVVSILSAASADDSVITLPKVSVTSSNDVATLPKEPTLQLAGADIVQDSITIRRGGGTNMFAVMWTYTEAGAQKALAFWDANPSPFVRHSEKWRAGWLKSPTDKCIFGSEDAARAFEAKLKIKRTGG